MKCALTEEQMADYAPPLWASLLWGGLFLATDIGEALCSWWKGIREACGVHFHHHSREARR